MYVLFKRKGDNTNYASICFYDDPKRQSELMHRRDIDRQVKEWQKKNSGNPPKFYSRIVIQEFTNTPINLVFNENKN